MTVAVVINQSAIASEEQIAANESPDTAQIQNLVANAVGIDSTRGDGVAVLVSQFRDQVLIETPIAWYENATLFGYAKMLLVALTFAIVILFVIRPLMESFSRPAAVSGGAMLDDDTLADEAAGQIDLEGGETLEEIKAKLKPKKSSISADMLDTANTYDDKVALVRMLVSEDSGRVANVLKKMVSA
jgi:flagellar M-ring protein FliF